MNKKNKEHYQQKLLMALGIMLIILLAMIIVAPLFYRQYATGKLADLLDKKYGKDGWIAASVVSDNQRGEQINLYRTLYFKLFYPKFISFTPYKKLRFTHNCVWATTPPHYAVLIYCREGTFAYRWSMKKSRWYVSYSNSVDILPKREREKILNSLKVINRIDGLNFSKNNVNATYP